MILEKKTSEWKLTACSLLLSSFLFAPLAAKFANTISFVTASPIPKNDLAAVVEKEKAAMGLEGIPIEVRSEPAVGGAFGDCRMVSPTQYVIRLDPDIGMNEAVLKHELCHVKHRDPFYMPSYQNSTFLQRLKVTEIDEPYATLCALTS